uniref:WD repeat-containing protein 49-like n=1 Tax=Odobenus rosmarus divergens TaxID=9708 RepID=UPI00063C0011|nr:PREDICTED: WD repeat-containing protein 49-like [Odobenus rosmarus divergens]
MGTTNVKQKRKETRAVRKDVEARREQAFLSLPQRRTECDQTVFRICKGVKAFSFCKRKNLPLTGGMDRIIPGWNPYLPGKPTGMLKSHTAPVIYIHVSAEDNKIFSMSTDNTIKVWDLETDSCLFTASSKASGIKGEFAACLYLPHSRALCVAADTAVLPHLRLRSGSPPEPYLVVSHQEPVVCCRYNPAFWQVVNCSEASVVKVWDFETGRLLSGFTGAHGNAGITCLTFDISGRRLITGGRDGCLKIWSYSNGHCLHTLQHDEKENEVCDCTYLEMNQHKYIIAVGWDKRINVYFDAPRDFHRFWKPQPHWQDDLNHGHKEDILCAAQCPPFLLATSSYDGEVIIWNVISGHMYCKLNTSSPSDGAEDRKSPNRSVSCLAFLETRAAKFESVAASLIANRPRGSVTFWRLFGGACSIANFTPSRDKAQVSSIAVTAGDALAYVADWKGFVHIYDIKEYGLQGPELQSPKSVTFWRAHVSVVTSLELIEKNFLLSSSLDCTVCLWSRGGEYIGTFGQHSPWDIFTPTSWSHPRVPYEILTDPQSMPAYPVLEGNVAAMHTEVEEQDNVAEEKAKPEKTPNPCSPEDPILEAEMKEDIDRWCAFRNGRLPLDQNQPSRRTCELGWPSIYQTLRCHEVACVSAVGEKPDLSIIGSDLLNLNFLAQEKEGREAAQEEH